jgi:hypothetical protein
MCFPAKASGLWPGTNFSYENIRMFAGTSGNVGVSRPTPRVATKLFFTRGHRRLEKPSKINLYPSDFDETGWNQNGKTCPVAPVMPPRHEKGKRASSLQIFKSYYIEMFSIYRHLSMYFPVFSDGCNYGVFH